MSKRLVFWLSSLVLAVAMLAASALVDKVAPAKAKRTGPTLLISGHPAYPPVAWAAQGKIVGAAPALVRVHT